MNIYYTAKDIEELAAKGTQQLEIGPRVFLTDFARETAQQLGITLVDGGKHAAPKAQPKVTRSTTTASDRYNKPTGCQHASTPPPAAREQDSVPLIPPNDSANSNTVNRLIDLMGKAIKRGG